MLNTPKDDAARDKQRGKEKSKTKKKMTEKKRKKKNKKRLNKIKQKRKGGPNTIIFHNEEISAANQVNSDPFELALRAIKPLSADMDVSNQYR